MTYNGFDNIGKWSLNKPWKFFTAVLMFQIFQTEKLPVSHLYEYTTLDNLLYTCKDVSATSAYL